MLRLVGFGRVVLVTQHTHHSQAKPIIHPNRPWAIQGLCVGRCEICKLAAYPAKSQEGRRGGSVKNNSEIVARMVAVSLPLGSCARFTVGAKPEAKAPRETAHSVHIRVSCGKCTLERADVVTHAGRRSCRRSMTADAAKAAWPWVLLYPGLAAYRSLALLSESLRPECRSC